MKNVSVLNLKNLKELIQDAVSNTLSDFGITLSQEELQQINDRAREEFLRVLTDRDDLKASMKNMESELANLRDNFLSLRTELEVNQRLLKTEEERVFEKSDAPLSSETMDNIEETLMARWDELMAKHHADGNLKDEAIRFTLNLIEEEREKAVIEAKDSQATRVYNLKRRIAKLNSKLKETEDLLDRVRSESHTDNGVASEFKGVQGLNDEALYHEEKEALLKEIFSLNMDLKRLMAET
ncbi:MAG: hypothetical protein KJ645_07950 [Planctomycetes bacterium]|nr:hypothetical protein [Planctomycetota bacterium]